MIRVAHLIHTTGIGGVEAAVDVIARRTRTLDYRILALVEIEPHAVEADVVGTGVNSPRSVVRILRGLREFAPEVLVTSLWRAVLIGAVYKTMHPATPWVLYLHNSRYTHVLDRWTHRLAFRLADRILCDSAATRDALVPVALRSGAEVVRPESVLMRMARESAGADRGTAANHAREATPCKILYWGRVAEQKRVDRCLDLMEAIEARAPGSFLFELIAPPSAELDRILDLALARSLRVQWNGPGDAEAIMRSARGAGFFLQLSDFEGLGMSVLEALALGVVPVLTPVGEIPEYTEDGVNAIHLRADDYGSTAARMIDLRNDPARWTEMSRAGRSVAGNDFVSDFERAMAAASHAHSPEPAITPGTAEAGR